MLKSIVNSDLYNEVCVKVHFSKCGLYVYTASVYATRAPSKGSAVELMLQLSADVLSPALTSTKRPKRLANTMLTLGSRRNSIVRKIPFTFTWTKEALYICMSDDKLRVLRVMLLNGSQSQFGEPTTPEKEIVLPRSARERAVHFLPAQSPKKMSIVVIGSRDRGTPSCSTAVYLQPSDLGQWIPAPQEGLEEVTKSSSNWRAEARFEEFDADEDCDLVPFDPNLQIF